MKLDHHLVTIVLIIIFIFSLIYYLYFNKNTIIGYQTIKNFEKQNADLSKLDDLYKRKTCDDYCSTDICNNYKIKLNNHKECLNCQKKFQCYNPFTNQCEFCLSLGINQCDTPINPINTLCN
jgi:hypothetical protein